MSIFILPPARLNQQPKTELTKRIHTRAPSL